MSQLLDETRQGRQEASLVRRARRGEREAFEELVRAHFSRVYRLLFRLAGNHEDAEDLAQESFVRAWRSIAWFRRDDGFGAWVARIALHLARDHHRARVRRGRSTELSFDPEAPGAGVTEESARRELLQGLRAALERLPERLRGPFVMRVLEGMGYDDVAVAAGITPATARTQVMKARRLLLRWMGPWLDRRAP